MGCRCHVPISSCNNVHKTRRILEICVNTHGPSTILDHTDSNYISCGEPAYKTHTVRFVVCVTSAKCRQVRTDLTQIVRRRPTGTLIERCEGEQGKPWIFFNVPAKYPIEENDQPERNSANVRHEVVKQRSTTTIWETRVGALKEAPMSRLQPSDKRLIGGIGS